MLRFDGLYRYVFGEVDAGYSGQSYLRFYEEGEVLSCSTGGTPEQVIRWFHRDNPAMPRGRWRAIHGTLYFSLLQDDALVAEEYEGYIMFEPSRRGWVVNLCTAQPLPDELSVQGCFFWHGEKFEDGVEMREGKYIRLYAFVPVSG